MTMPFYASAEQIMRDRSEYARKGIARGRGVVVLKFDGGILFVAENPSSTLHKVGEIYDRIGFAAAGRYNEYENLRVAGVRYADLWGYSNSRSDVSGRAVANAYAQTLGAIFTEQQKPYEVELCVAEVGAAAAADQLYRLTYDGSIVDEPDYVVMGGQADVIGSSLRERYAAEMSLAEAVQAAVRALASVTKDSPRAGEPPRRLGAPELEIAVLDRARATRAFRRLTGRALADLLPSDESGVAAAADANSGTASKADVPEADVPEVVPPGSPATPAGVTVADEREADAGSEATDADGDEADEPRTLPPG